jgi:ribosome maturation factor RimP
MSGSSRHGSVRPPATAGGRAAGRPGSGRDGAGRDGAGGNGAAGNNAGRDGSRNAGSKAGGARDSGTRNGGARNGAAPRPAPVDPDRLTALLEPVVSASDLDLEAVRITMAGRRRLLRIVVDGDGGVSLDNIALVSRNLSAVLDDSPIMGDVPYTLEVSSPGVDRPLTERRHWRRATGRLVTVPLTGDEDAVQDAVEGRILDVDADGVTLEIAGESRVFGYGDLGPGKIKIEFAPIGTGPGDEDPEDEDDDIDEGADEEGPDGY